MRTFIVLLLSISFLVIAFHSGCISDQDELSIVLFTADPSVIQPGDITMIRWMVTGAADVSIAPLIGSVDLAGNMTLQLNQTTTFTLVANNSNETITKTIEVVVQESEDHASIIIDDSQFEDAKRDPVDIININIINDLISFDIGYSGGCENHTFQLISKEAFMESDPVQVDVVISHDDKDDSCDAYLYETITFDLAPLKQKWQNEYQKDSGTIILIIEDHTEVIGYTFGQDQFSFLNISIETNRKVYGINETIDISIYVENKKTSDVYLEFPSSQIADFLCMDNSGDIVYTWSHGRMFLSVITPVTIPAGSTMEFFSYNWSRMDNDGIVLTDGNYTLQGFIPGFYYQDETIDYSQKPGPILYSDFVEITFV